jgi:hypothetical protein
MTAISPATALLGDNANLASNQAELLERLKKRTIMVAHGCMTMKRPDPDCEAAAKEIERLQAELDAYKIPSR